LAAALILQFPPRNFAELFLVQTTTAARWRLLRTWGIQTAGFELEMAKTAKNLARPRAPEPPSPPSPSGTWPTPPASSPSSIASKSAKALAMLLKLREIPDSTSDPSAPPHLATETWDDDFQIEANLESRI
jgi:hypothetical protein